MTRSGISSKNSPKQQLTPDENLVIHAQGVDFVDALTPRLTQLVHHFFGVETSARLLTIAQNPHYYWVTQDFYVAQKGLDEDGKCWAQLRFSEGFCQVLFEKTLGKDPRDTDFSLSSIRNFEVFLLERFSAKLFHLFAPTLFQAPKTVLLPHQLEELVHLVWVFNHHTDNPRQLVLTLPKACLKWPQEAVSPEAQRLVLSQEKQDDLGVLLNFVVGQTKAQLEDCQNLEVGDLLVFEDSRLDTWWLQDPQHKSAWQPIPITLSGMPMNKRWLHTKGTSEMSQQPPTRPSIWDNLEVDVTAAFETIKLPLKQVKEMEKGLVMEVGDLLEQQIQILVEGTPVAFGELLVLGDKFAVRIQGLCEQSDEGPITPQVGFKGHASNPEPIAAVEPVAATTQAPEAPENKTEDEDADDIDFDDDDFDDLDDEEDWA